MPKLWMRCGLLGRLTTICSVWSFASDTHPRMAVSTDSVYLPTSDRCGFFMLKDYFQDVSPVYNNAVCVCVYLCCFYILSVISPPCLWYFTHWLSYCSELWPGLQLDFSFSVFVFESRHCFKRNERTTVQFFLIYILLMVKVWCKHTLGPKTETILSFGFNYERITCGIWELIFQINMHKPVWLFL